MACTGHLGSRGRCNDGRACSTGLPGSRHRGEHGRVSADRHTGGLHRGADGLAFPTAQMVTRQDVIAMHPDFLQPVAKHRHVDGSGRFSTPDDGKVGTGAKDPKSPHYSLYHLIRDPRYTSVEQLSRGS
jgi:hypothetical protein